MQKQVPQEEQKPDDEPEPRSQEFERNNRKFTHNGGQQQPHKGPRHPIGKRMPEQPGIHWKPAHGSKNEQEQQACKDGFGGQIHPQSPHLHFL